MLFNPHRVRLRICQILNYEVETSLSVGGLDGNLRTVFVYLLFEETKITAVSSRRTQFNFQGFSEVIDDPVYFEHNI